MLMEDELESQEDTKTLKKLGTIRLPPTTKVFTDQRQNLIIQNDLYYSFATWSSFSMITLSFQGACRSPTSGT